MRDVRHVVFHTPGPNWVVDKPFFEQAGVQAHVAHYRKLHADGKLEFGGPFLDKAAGGMMISVPGVPYDELVAFANADPAVAAGLLRAEVREWLVGMKS